MTHIAIRLGDAAELEAYLTERIYEHNAAAPGYHDAELFSAAQTNESGAVEAGLSGPTWGGCCFVSHLWVAERSRRKGLGTELLKAVEDHARSKRCRWVLLSSHSFQAPEFYTRRGYKPVARVNDYPLGHSDVFYAKCLNRT